jgi:hypothetical protein
MTLLSVTNICVTNEHRYVRSHNLVLYPFMKYLRVCNKSNTTSSTSGTGTANSSGAPEFTFGFSGVLVARSLILYIMFGRLLFVVLYLFLLLCYSSSFFDIRSVFPLWYLHALHPFVVNTIRAFLRSWLITWFVTRITLWLLLVEQELPTLPEHMCSSPVLMGSCCSIFSFLCITL